MAARLWRFLETFDGHEAAAGGAGDWGHSAEQILVPPGQLVAVEAAACGIQRYKEHGRAVEAQVPVPEVGKVADIQRRDAQQHQRESDVRHAGRSAETRLSTPMEYDASI